MTNAELIAELRGHILSVPLTLLHEAADALEAADAKIVKLNTKCADLQSQIYEMENEIEELLPKEGEWIKYNNPNYSPFDDSGEYLYQCNKCGKVVVKATNYCPHCGALLRGEHDEQ